MKKLYLPLVISASAILSLVIACKIDKPGAGQDKHGQQLKTTAKNLNLSIFLDLSDRISPKKYPNQTMEVYKRDLGYIKSIGEAFQQHLNGSKISGMDDQIQLFFEPEPKDPQINELAHKMKFVFDKSTVTSKSIASITPTYVSCADKIYQIALKEDKYIGSDIWTFFKNKVKDQCIKKGHNNILVIITDGYMFHEDNRLKVKNQTSYLTPGLIKQQGLNNAAFADRMQEKGLGFIPATTGLNELKVLVIGINSQKGKDFEEDIIKKYWGDWFEKMGIKNYEIKGIDLPTYMDTIIKKEILNK